MPEKARLKEKSTEKSKETRAKTPAAAGPAKKSERATKSTSKTAAKTKAEKPKPKTKTPAKKSSAVTAKTKTASTKAKTAKPKAAETKPAAADKKSPAKKPAAKTVKKPAAKAKAPAKPAAPKTAPAKAAAKKPANDTAAKTVRASRAGKIAAREPEEARPAAEKTIGDIPADPKPVAAEKPKPTPANRKVKATRPIAFTLDEAIEIARKSGAERKESSPKESGKRKKTEESGPKPQTPAAEEIQPENRVLGAASIADILGYNPATGPKPNENDGIPKKFLRYYKLLIELRDHVKTGLDERTKETLKRSSKEDSGNLSAYSQHMADIGTDTFDRDFALSLVSSEQDALYEIEDAIRRMKQGTYGICEITGKPINEERLMAVPFARYSLEGQIEHERTNRRHSLRTGTHGETSGEGLRFMDTESDDD